MSLNLSDAEILERIKKGDEKAFELLYKAYFKILCVFAYRIVKNPDVAEEIVQDIFFHIWEKRRLFDLTTSFKSYLFRAVHNNSLKYLRHQKIVNSYENSGGFSGTELVTGQQLLEESEVFQILHQVVDSLPERSREIFELNRFKGMKYQEIAGLLSLSVKTVEAHMSAVLKTLRKCLKDYGQFVWVLIFIFFS